jgi:hypothetical protein
MEGEMFRNGEGKVTTKCLIYVSEELVPPSSLLE